MRLQTAGNLVHRGTGRRPLFRESSMTDRAALLSLAETATPILVSFMFSYPLRLMLRAVMGRLRSRDSGRKGAFHRVRQTSKPLGMMREW